MLWEGLTASRSSHHFLTEMERPDGASLDRIDLNSIYELSNCKKNAARPL
jgi:hypothetical protein